MKHIFEGKKKLITIPLGILFGLFFLPLTILGLLFWFTKRHIPNPTVKKVIYSVLGLFSLPFFISYLIAFTTPSTPKTLHVVPLETTMSVTPQPTEKPVMVAATPVEAVLGTTIAKPTTTPSQTLRPTVKPTPKPTATAPSTPRAMQSGYTCDCSRTCTEISSCAEAQYQLNVCGCRVRDNDHDGIACDSAPLHCQN